MKIFQCQACDQPLSFESTECESCQRRLGYVCAVHEMSALEPSGNGLWHAYAHPGQKYRFCANAGQDACNWLVPESSPRALFDEVEAGSSSKSAAKQSLRAVPDCNAIAHGSSAFCTACRHNRVVPDLAADKNMTRWRQIEAAKHRLFYTLMRLGLPLADRKTSSDGLAFDFLVDPAENQLTGPPVLTGHDNGLITINIAEADDVERERRRMLFGEFYRTLLGHFRHEIGHYFWNVLVRYDASLAAFRTIFGDESVDYGTALQRHYADGPPPAWEESYVSAYATAHPWEDFAETWAHYLHIVDTLETASAFEIRLRPKLRNGAEPPDAPVHIDFDPYAASDFDALITAWLPLTYAVNSLNRSMGQPALYPFKLTPSVIAKLAFVHERIYAVRADGDASTAGSDMLKAVIAGLRGKVAAPTT